jgi:hypothetical protein
MSSSSSSSAPPTDRVWIELEHLKHRNRHQSSDTLSIQHDKVDSDAVSLTDTNAQSLTPSPPSLLRTSLEYYGAVLLLVFYVYNFVALFQVLWLVRMIPLLALVYFLLPAAVNVYSTILARATCHERDSTNTNNAVQRRALCAVKIVICTIALIVAAMCLVFVLASPAIRNQMPMDSAAAITCSTPSDPYSEEMYAESLQTLIGNLFDSHYREQFYGMCSVNLWPVDRTID